MILENVELYNVSEAEQRAGLPGWILHRFPAEVRESVNTDAADLCRSVEIRFVLEEQRHIGGTVYLLSRSCDGEAAVYYGDYQQSGIISLPAGVITPVAIRFPEQIAQLPQGRFPNRLCRVFINSRSPVSYIGHEWLNIRPPKKEEVPRKVLVGYGSSITNGGLARSNCGCFLQLCARRLGMDALNLGLSGSCTVNRETVDYLADKVHGDVFFLEMGVNVMDSVPREEFALRVRYAVNTVAKAHPEAQVIATAIFPNRHAGEKFDACTDAVRGAVHTASLPNLHYIPGDQLLSDAAGLSTDGLHPSDWGHMVIAENLARVIGALL